MVKWQKAAATPGADLEDMQSLLYLLEEGEAHQRAGKLNLALKRFHGVVKVGVPSIVIKPIVPDYRLVVR